MEKSVKTTCGDTPTKGTAPYTCSVVVCSDRASSGTYEDKSGPAAIGWLKGHQFVQGGYHVIADDIQMLKRIVLNDANTHDLVVISGGTGVSPRDITPQTLKTICDYEIPGIGELLRAGSLKYSLNAYLSRCGGWVLGRSLVLALPGNPKAVVEQLDILSDLLPHALKAIAGNCDHRRRLDTNNAQHPAVGSNDGRFVPQMHHDTTSLL